MSESAQMWRLDTHSRREYPRVTDERGRFVADCADGQSARLISAAPELLDALKGVLRVADRATDEFDVARAAIAKAEGTS